MEEAHGAEPATEPLSCVGAEPDRFVREDSEVIRRFVRIESQAMLSITLAEESVGMDAVRRIESVIKVLIQDPEVKFFRFRSGSVIIDFKISVGSVPIFGSSTIYTKLFEALGSRILRISCSIELAPSEEHSILTVSEMGRWNI